VVAVGPAELAAAWLQRPHGLVAGPIAEVSRSLAAAAPADVEAIAIFIASLSGRATIEEAGDADLVIASAQRPRVEASLYASACARCHEPAASGVAAIAHPLALRRCSIAALFFLPLRT
jgi:hypothetical protein